MVVENVPGAALLDRFAMVSIEEAPAAWRAYVLAVRAMAEDPDESPELRAEAAKAAKGLDPDDPPERPSDAAQDDDPEGFGMDEPAEGEGGSVDPEERGS